MMHSCVHIMCTCVMCDIMKCFQYDLCACITYTWLYRAYFQWTKCTYMYVQYFGMLYILLPGQNTKDILLEPPN